MNPAKPPTNAPTIASSGRVCNSPSRNQPAAPTSRMATTNVRGLAKTLMVQTVAEALELKFSRIQFTPDLMPSDITGTEIIEEDVATGKRGFRFVRGPVFANIVLADEVNRTPPKTQAALLQAMQEHQVSAAGQTHHLPSPFFVLATQNPIEQEGTYPSRKRSSIASCSSCGWTIRRRKRKRRSSPRRPAMLGSRFGPSSPRRTCWRCSTCGGGV